ncbi:MAG: chromosome segregation protein SMC [Deltaproteobacteria bacterium]|nr:MAG: chromosome segregation protein SMC [Deltaproteobacteria bacterium]
MRIKRIEIIGFKSFCDRTVLEFHDPVTAVVGPNGCGKSNIVDAIRWCMGEQSAKHLRGSAMGDVIFNGSETRGPAGMAEVSLTFEDVGFSQEQLALALERAEAEAAAAAGGDPAEAAVADGEAQVEAGAPDAAPADGEPGASGAHEEAAAGGAAGERPGTPPAERSATAEVADLLADKPPAIDFSQYSEVTVTRRLFRDGTSGYFINKIPCRLRDVTDFFLGTGVGTKAYSIIEQGRIGMIVSARPADRRLLIEEAAGITKFKTKKRLAERKLDRTRQNLLRVNDIVDELGKRLGSLRRQAQKAARYRRYKAELKDIDMWIASHRFLELTAADGVLRARLEDLTRRRDDARAELDAGEARIAAERSELAIEERRLSALQEEIYELDNRIKLDEEKIKYETREADDLERRASEGSAEIKALVERREEVARELAEARAEYAAVEEAAIAEEEELHRREEALAEARERLDAAQRRLDDARAEAAAARTDMARADSQQQAIARHRADASARRERLEAERVEARERLAELERQVRDGEAALGELRQMQMDLGDRAKQLEARLDALREETDRAEAHVETLRTELHRRKSRYESLREIQQKYEGFTQGTKAVMQREGARDRIRGLVADVVSTPPRYEAAVEAALGDRLGGILVDDCDAGVEAIQYLKEAEAGRSAFVPLPAPAGIAFEDRSGAPSGDGVMGAMVDLVTCEPAYMPVAQRLLSDYWVVENLDVAVRLHNAGCTKTLVTLDGDIVDGRGVVVGGSRDGEGAGVLAQKREIRELGDIIEALEADLANATAAYVSNKAECQQVARALDAARRDSHTHEIDILGREKDVARSRGELDRLRARLAQLDRELADLADALAEMEREGQTAAELLASARERAERHESEQGGLVEAVDLCRRQVDELSRALTDRKVRVAQLDEKKAALSATVLRLEQNAEELVERTASLEEAIRTAVERAARLRDDARALEDSLVERRAMRRERAEALDAGRAGYEQRLGLVQVAETELRQLRATAEQLAQQVTAVDMERHDVRAQLAHLEETIAERYRVELRREVGDYHLRPEVGEEQHKRLAELRNLIDRMGTDINLTAPEEYEQISERYEFLSAQKADLESACEQLEKAIRKMNRTSRKLFRETFDEINARFQKVFPRLFRGGSASLSLTGDENTDILDAGVEIMARPPGKKNATVDQLSGGEKALTAVALIFAIFLFKPSPFCLLDEVDAPLDEVNVDRYNEIVREMTDRSQFIVITHNKRTMEMADHLYGITMQEPGVSKVVSVNLRSVDEFAA